MRRAALSRLAAGLVFVLAMTACASFAWADLPGRGAAGSAWAILGGLSLTAKLAAPARPVGLLLLALTGVRSLFARRRARAATATLARPARYSPYALPARVAVALAAAERARR